MYFNSPFELHDLIAVTENSLHIESEGRRYSLPFRELVNVLSPEGVDPRTATELTAFLTNGRRVLVPVLGGNDRFRDAREFLRFLMRVRDDFLGRERQDGANA